MIPWKVIRSSRRTISVEITPEAEVLVRCPNQTPEALILLFLENKRSWIEKHLAKRAAAVQPGFTPEELRELTTLAARELPGRAAHWAPLVGVSFNRVTIRAQRSRWASCSSKGNLNFNCLLMLTPPEVRDYVVVHELCHRKEMNHSPRFWAEVERVMPDYKIHLKWLKDNGGALIARLKNPSA